MILTTTLVCLSLTVFFEARGEDVAGQLAVAQVVLNRVEASGWRDNVCDVVHQGGEASPDCQFSWYCDGKSDTPWETKAWEQALLVASAALAGSGHGVLKDATHYHADYASPDWAEGLTVLAVFGRHIYYE